MAIEIPDTEPARVRAGDTVTWRKTLDDYPANAGWTLYYRAINSTAKVDITSAADGASHLVTVAKATTAGWTAGTYTLLSWVTSATERVSFPSVSLIIDPDLAAVSAAGYDTRSQAKKMLDAIDAALLSLSSGERLAVVEAELAGRRLKYDFNGLQRLRQLYAAQVRTEENAARIASGLPPRNSLNVRI